MSTLLSSLDNIQTREVSAEQKTKRMATVTETVTNTLRGSLRSVTTHTPHDVETTLYYYKQSGDGSPPAPFIVG